MRLRVLVLADDDILAAGVAAHLRTTSDLLVVADGADVDADVAVVVVDRMDDGGATMVRKVQRTRCPRVLLVVSALDHSGFMKAIEVGVSGVIRRQEANGGGLVSALRNVARGDGTLPADLISRLLSHVSRLQNEVLSPLGIDACSGLTEREVAVLRLLADGHDTAYIANELAYSPRTIKNIVHNMSLRLHLRNRSHAVAYAYRAGVL